MIQGEEPEQSVGRNRYRGFFLLNLIKNLSLFIKVSLWKNRRIAGIIGTSYNQLVKDTE